MEPHRLHEVHGSDSVEGRRPISVAVGETESGAHYSVAQVVYAYLDSPPVRLTCLCDVNFYATSVWWLKHWFVIMYLVYGNFTCAPGSIYILNLRFGILVKAFRTNEQDDWTKLWSLRYLEGDYSPSRAVAMFRSVRASVAFDVWGAICAVSLRSTQVAHWVSIYLART